MPFSMIFQKDMSLKLTSLLNFGRKHSLFPVKRLGKYVKWECTVLHSCNEMLKTYTWTDHPQKNRMQSLIVYTFDQKIKKY